MHRKLAPLVVVLGLLLSLDGIASASRQARPRLRGRALVAHILRNVATKIAPRPVAEPAPEVAPPAPLGRISGYVKTRIPRTVPRGKPNEPDTLETTTTETWSEELVTSAPRVVPGTGIDFDGIGLSKDEDAAYKGRKGIWTQVTLLEKHLAGSTATMRRSAGPLIARVIEAARSATFRLSDGRPELTASDLTVYGGEATTGKGTRLSIYGAGGSGRIAEIELDLEAGFVKVYEAGKHTVTELRTPDGRAVVEKTRVSRREVRASAKQRRIDEAFAAPASAED